jgi:hypothetical protein
VRRWTRLPRSRTPDHLEFRQNTDLIGRRLGLGGQPRAATSGSMSFAVGTGTRPSIDQCNLVRHDHDLESFTYSQHHEAKDMLYSRQATIPAISYCVSGWLMLDRSVVNGERAERGAFTQVVCLGEGG